MFEKGRTKVMDVMLKTSVWLTSMLLLFLAGCVPLSTQESPLPLTVEGPIAAPSTNEPADAALAFQTPQVDPATATVIGIVISASVKDAAAVVGMPVRLARVFWNEDKSDGAFVLEGATSPSALIAEDGSFILSNVPPADYVIVVGDPVGSNVIISEANGRARVITLEAGEVFNVGRLEVALNP